MPRIPPLDRPATYDDLVKVPDIMVAEIVDGELHASPRPAPRHANVTSALASAVFAPYHHGRGGPGGWLILFEPELHLGRNVLVPDLAGWRRSRMPRLPAEAHFSVAPDWVCEVLSPSTASTDRVDKLQAYFRAGVPHYWLLDPAEGTLEVYRRTDLAYALVLTAKRGQRVQPEPFDAEAFEVNELLGDDG
jgi:Uma2 family endonuclease